MHPIVFQTDLWGLLGTPITLRTYGMMIATGFLLALSMIRRQAAREDEDPERFVDLGFYVFLAGLAGARVLFIFTKLSDYARNPLQILMFWNGGLVWYGGFLGAIAFLIFYCRRHRIDFFKVADLFVPYMALAHAFGRFGCLAAGCCYGKACELPWAIHFPQGSLAHQGQAASLLVGIDQDTLPVHPTQLYEAGLEIALFWLLLTLRPKKRFHGQVFLAWLSIYPVARSLIEIFRGDKERGVYILSTSQYISIFVGAAACILFFVLRQRRVASLNNTLKISV